MASGSKIVWSWRRALGVALGVGALVGGGAGGVGMVLGWDGGLGVGSAVAGGVGALCGCGVVWLVLMWPSGASAPARVWEALRDIASGKLTDLRAARIDGELGEAAAVWNRIVCEREKLERMVELRRADQAVSPGAVGGGSAEKAFGLLPQGVLVVGADGRIEYANAAAGLSLSRSAEELVGKTPSEAGLSEGAAGFIEEMRSGKRRQRGSFEQREEGGAGEGPTVLRLTARPAKRGSVGRLYVTVDDVTQQRMADEARNALIASATHELRTPLTNIRLYVEEVIDAGEDDRESRAHALNVISKESRRLERIVTDLLSVAELESGSMRLNIDEIRLGDMLGELEGDFRQQAESKGIALRFDLPPKVPVISGDRDRFELVMHNLVGNALKYTDSGGRVDVRLEESGGHVEIAVSDTGMGIPEGECEKIFDRFFRAGDGRVKDIQGTGLGLTIAREIARRHGGDITVESVVGEGSVFTLRVPGGGARARAA